MPCWALQQEGNISAVPTMATGCTSVLSTALINRAHAHLTLRRQRWPPQRPCRRATGLRCWSGSRAAMTPSRWSRWPISCTQRSVQRAAAAAAAALRPRVAAATLPAHGSAPDQELRTVALSCCGSHNQHPLCSASAGAGRPGRGGGRHCIVRAPLCCGCVPACPAACDPSVPLLHMCFAELPPVPLSLSLVSWLRHAAPAPACRLLQELPPESGRVLRRVLLSDANSQFEAGGCRRGHGMPSHEYAALMTSRLVGFACQRAQRHACCRAGVGLPLVPAVATLAMFTLMWIAARHTRNMACMHCTHAYMHALHMHALTTRPCHSCHLFVPLMPPSHVLTWPFLRMPPLSCHPAMAH